MSQLSRKIELRTMSKWMLALLVLVSCGSNVGAMLQPAATPTFEVTHLMRPATYTPDEISFAGLASSEIEIATDTLNCAYTNPDVATGCAEDVFHLAEARARMVPPGSLSYLNYLVGYCETTVGAVLMTTAECLNSTDSGLLAACDRKVEDALQNCREAQDLADRVLHGIDLYN
jgi:hypothetical protein